MANIQLLASNDLVLLYLFGGPPAKPTITAAGLLVTLLAPTERGFIDVNDYRKRRGNGRRLEPQTQEDEANSKSTQKFQIYVSVYGGAFANFTRGSGFQGLLLSHPMLFRHMLFTLPSSAMRSRCFML